MRRSYPSDISREQFSKIEPLLSSIRKVTRPRELDLYDVFCAILYLLKTACQWRMLPKDLPPWGTVHYYFRRWRLEGAWFGIHEKLRRDIRQQEKKAEHPTIGIMDSQSVKTTEKRGCTGMMQVKGSKGVNAIY